MFVICFDMDTSLESNYEPRFFAVGKDHDHSWLHECLRFLSVC